MQAIRKRLLTLIMVFSLLPAFGVTLPSEASAESNVITKILTTLSSTPVALVDPALITVATSTPGVYIASAGWFDAAGNPVYGAFNTETYKLEINLGVNDGYTIDPDVACYLNNSAITSYVNAAGTAVTLTREYTADVWAPTIYKQPGGETVEEGGWASFVVSGSYARDYQWSVVDPDGRTSIAVDTLKNTYKNTTVTGNGSTKLIIHNIPYELNGWGVVCDFIGAGEGNVTRSKPAVITVNPSASRLAAIEAAAEAAANPTPTPTPTPAAVEATPTPEPEATPEPAYSDVWSYDARGHWHASLDGSAAAADEGLHSFVWTEIQPASDTEAGLEQGVCEECGYTATRRFGGPEVSGVSSENDAGEKSAFLDNLTPPTPLMAVLSALLPVDLALAIGSAHSAAKKRRRKRRR
ncbi:MAG: hypothetical protein IJV40_04500 [Oscillospiraceae bacterium]|nr:hypothetical protein [Oscillospiraceae bacterium]